MIHFVETKYGFEFGAAKIERAWSLWKKVCISLETQRHVRAKHSDIEIRVTATGNVRIFTGNAEWQPPRKTRRKSA